MKKFVIFGVALLTAFDPAWGQNIANTLTVNDMFVRVYRNNPTLGAAREELNATLELYPQAMAGWYPSLNAEASIISTNIEAGNFNDGDGATTKSGSINIEQPLFRGFRTTGETEAAKRRIDAGYARLRGIEQDVFLRSIESYVNVIRDRQMLELQQKNRDILSREEESVQARYDAGDLTQTDKRQTEARLSKSTADEVIAKSNLLASEAAFEEVVGITPPDYMEMPDVPFRFPHTIEALTAEASFYNPDLSRTRSDHAAAREDIRIVESTFYPQVAAFASYLKEYDPQPGIVPESETGAIGLRARINLYEGGKNISQRREAKFRANKRLIEIRETEMAVKRELIAEWRRYQAYDAEIAARALAVTAARFSADGVREEANMGERLIQDMLQAEQEVLDAQNSLVEARRGRVMSGYRLAAALGMLTPERLGITE